MTSSSLNCCVACQVTWSEHRQASHKIPEISFCNTLLSMVLNIHRGARERNIIWLFIPNGLADLSWRVTEDSKPERHERWKESLPASVSSVTQCTFGDWWWCGDWQWLRAPAVTRLIMPPPHFRQMGEPRLQADRQSDLLAPWHIKHDRNIGTPIWLPQTHTGCKMVNVEWRGQWKQPGNRLVLIARMRLLFFLGIQRFSKMIWLREPYYSNMV